MKKSNPLKTFHDSFDKRVKTLQKAQMGMTKVQGPVTESTAKGIAESNQMMTDVNSIGTPTTSWRPKSPQEVSNSNLYARYAADADRSMTKSKVGEDIAIQKKGGATKSKKK
jgi:hypothetical protein